VAGSAGLAVLLISRLHYAPKYLFHFDSANFALAIQSFNPFLHQPQPPGYPLFVALLDLIHAFGGDANRCLTVAGLVGSVAALALLWFWADRMLGRDAAWIAAALLLMHPVFWLAGIANPVRVFHAVALSGVAWASWTALSSTDPAPGFYAAAVALGVAAGFRPDALPMLAPLWLAVGLYRRLGLRQIAMGFGILSAAVALWLVPMAVRMGGLVSMGRFFAAYMHETAPGYPTALSGTWSEGLGVVRKVMVWTFGGCLAWIWATPFVWGRFRRAWDRPRIALLAAALLPALLFHTLVYVHSIDEALISIPITCLAGGVALAAIPRHGVRAAAVLVALLASYWLFRRPPDHDMAGASGSAVRYVETETAATYDALNGAASGPGTVAVWYDAFVPWRNVSYYYPDLPVLVLQTNGPPLWVRGEQAESPASAPDGALALPRSTRRVVLGVSESAATGAAVAWPGSVRAGPLVWVDVKPGERFRVGSASFVVER